MLFGANWQDHHLLITHGNSNTLLDRATQEEFFEWHGRTYGGLPKIYTVVDLSVESFELLEPMFTQKGQIIHGEGA